MPSMAALYSFLNLHRNTFPGVYRRSGGPGKRPGGFEQRFLTENEIIKIRKMTFHGKAESRFATAGRPRGVTNARRHNLAERMLARLATG